ncbi:hypothetical protein [Flavobacterium sp. AED]|uniref:hypothetical protein n=1 Tax=Flavobacterium sp. AED TaxID=1423323 RepID=UPI00057D0674|nr:hypothetical protein [Flavobacterium sp. AED]KIA86493.1 hypothetical protein OA85_02160 [Flavobacterium sp. AED]MDI1303896.1 hypothetical protein [bacterium]
MKTKFTILALITTILGSVLFFVSCSNEDVIETQSSSNFARQTSISSKNSTTGIASAIPAYYDAKLFNIIFVEFTPQASAILIAQNPGINFIYQSDAGLPGGLPFISVIDAIPGDGMNPIWEEVQIAFNSGHTARQLFSDDEISAAVANNEITLIPTGEVYKCPVIGK